MNPEDRTNAGRAVVAKILGEEASRLSRAIRDAIEPNLEPGEHVTAQLGDGTRVGKVRRNEQSVTAVVTDEPALKAWVEAHRPEEIVTTKTIRSSYLDYLKALVKQHGMAFDETTAEIIPGIEAVEGSASFVVTPSPEGRALVKAKLAELAGGLLELPASPDSERRAS